MTQKFDRSHTETILLSFIEIFCAKQCPARTGILQVNLQPEGESWFIQFSEGGEVQLHAGVAEDAFLLIKTSGETLQRLYDGDLSPITAIGRAHYSDPAPLDFVPGKNIKLVPGSADYISLLEFVQRFFNRTQPERILLGEAHTRLVHGGHVVGLYYGTGFRSAWYLLKKGERLNTPEDTNPFPQAFIFLSGSGKAQLGDHLCDVKGGESYHIPPGSAHMVWNELDEPLELLFLAWGEGA